MFLDKIKQLKEAMSNQDIETQINVVEELLQSEDRDVIFAVDNAIGGNTSLYLKYCLKGEEEFELDSLKEDLGDLVECFIEYEDYLKYSEFYDGYEDYDYSNDYNDSLLSYYKEYERKAFGKTYVDGFVKDDEGYTEISEEDLDY